MFKVANIIEEGRYGGPHARIIAVAVKLKEQGFETTVICPAAESEVFLEKLSTLKILVISIRLHHLTRHFPHLLKYLILFIPEVLALAKVIAMHKYALVHCNAAWQVKGVLAAKLVGAKVVWHLNDTYTPIFIKKMFFYLAKNFADGFIVSCQRAKDYYLDHESLLKKPNILIQAPVDIKEFAFDQVYPDHTISKNSCIKVVTVCNVNPNKGIDVFLQMCNFLNKRVSPFISYWVVGAVYESQVKYAEKLKQIIKKMNLKNVHLMGQSNNVKGILKAADIYVCTSWYESSPISVWEAMSMAKPIVSTDVGDVAQFFEKGQCGFVVPVGDAVALAEKVALLIEDENLRKTLGSRARAFAEENLDVSICAEKHISFYKQIIQGSDDRTKILLSQLD